MVQPQYDASWLQRNRFCLRAAQQSKTPRQRGVGWILRIEYDIVDAVQIGKELCLILSNGWQRQGTAAAGDHRAPGPLTGDSRTALGLLFFRDKSWLFCNRVRTLNGSGERRNKLVLRRKLNALPEVHKARAVGREKQGGTHDQRDEADAALTDEAAGFAQAGV